MEFEPLTLPGTSRRYAGLTRELRTVLGREVDLPRIGTIENEYLQEAIDRSREVVFDCKP